MNCLIKPKIKMYLVTYIVTSTTDHKAEGQSVLTSHKPVGSKTLRDWQEIIADNIDKQYQGKVKAKSIEITKYEPLTSKRKEKLYGKV